MEGVFLLFVLLFYILLRLIFGFKVSEVDRDKKRFAAGLAMMRRREFGPAMEYFTNMVEHYPRSAYGYMCRGRCYLELGDNLMALADCRKAVAIEHYLPEAYLASGIALYRIGDYAEALVHFDRAVWVSRDNPEALRWRGLAYARCGERIKSFADFRAASSLGDEHASFYLRRGGIADL